MKSTIVRTVVVTLELNTFEAAWLNRLMERPIDWDQRTDMDDEAPTDCRMRIKFGEATDIGDTWVGEEDD